MDEYFCEHCLGTGFRSGYDNARVGRELHALRRSCRLSAATIAARMQRSVFYVEGIESGIVALTPEVIARYRAAVEG